MAEPDGRVTTWRCFTTVRPSSKLIRFVAGPDDQIVPDLAARLPGRGVWVTATRAAVQEAAEGEGDGRDVDAPGAPGEGGDEEGEEFGIVMPLSNDWSGQLTGFMSKEFLSSPQFNKIITDHLGQSVLKFTRKTK